MLRHCDGKLPPVLDPFAGGGSIPLEAARLGFPAHAADLNPVAVLLNKCNLELAPRWAGRPPVNPDDRRRIGGAQAWKWHARAGGGCVATTDASFVPARTKKSVIFTRKCHFPQEHGGGEANVIAWLWARTVASQDPAAEAHRCHCLRTFWVCTAPGKLAWIEPDRGPSSERISLRSKNGHTC